MKPKKRKKKLNQKEVDALVEVFCQNIADILLECGSYPGTEDFNETYRLMMGGIASEIKQKVIKLVRQKIDV